MGGWVVELYWGAVENICWTVVERLTLPVNEIDEEIGVIEIILNKMRVLKVKFNNKTSDE